MTSNIATASYNHFLHFEVDTHNSEISYSGKISIPSLRDKVFHGDDLVEKIKTCLKNLQPPVDLASLDSPSLRIKIPVTFQTTGTSERWESKSYTLEYKEMPSNHDSINGFIFERLKGELGELLGGDPGGWIGPVRTLTVPAENDEESTRYYEATKDFPVCPEYTLFCGEERVATSLVQVKVGKTQYDITQSVIFSILYPPSDLASKVDPLIRQFHFDKTPSAQAMYDSLVYGGKFRKK